MSKVVAVHNHTGEVLLCTRYDTAPNKSRGAGGYELLVHPGTKQNLQWTEATGDPSGSTVLASGPAGTRESFVDDAHPLEIPTAYGWSELREGQRHMDIYRVVDARLKPQYSKYGLVEYVSSIYLQTGDGLQSFGKHQRQKRFGFLHG